LSACCGGSFPLDAQLKEQPAAPGNGWASARVGFAALSNATVLSLFPFSVGWAMYPLWRTVGRGSPAAALWRLGL